MLAFCFQKSLVDLICHRSLGALFYHIYCAIYFLCCFFFSLNFLSFVSNSMYTLVEGISLMTQGLFFVEGLSCGVTVGAIFHLLTI